MDELTGGTLVTETAARQLHLARAIELELRRLGVTEENAHEYRKVEEYIPGVGMRLVRVENKNGDTILRVSQRETR